jgi:pSer/pThr/pTyr-binding forkhead associated (FHA) protein
MMQPQAGTVPYLVVLSPGSQRGRRVDLTEGRLVVGRADTCDVRFDDPHVSRTHAALWRQGSAVYVEDLGSSGGTFVNGIPADRSHELRPGDVVTVATLKLRFEAGPAAAEETRVGPVAPSVTYDVGQQYADAINNVGHNQYNSYVQHVSQQRENFLREIAATRTKARGLVWTGLLFFVVGFGLFAAAILGFMKQGAESIQTGNIEPPTNPFGPEIAGIPSGLLGWALAALGALLLGTGIVLHIVATSRRRRVDREFLVPPPPLGETR